MVDPSRVPVLEVPMGKKPRLALLLLAAASLVAVTIDYALTEMSSSNKLTKIS